MTEEMIDKGLITNSKFKNVYQEATSADNKWSVTALNILQTGSKGVLKTYQSSHNRDWKLLEYVLLKIRNRVQVLLPLDGTLGLILNH